MQYIHFSVPICRVILVRLTVELGYVMLGVCARTFFSYYYCVVQMRDDNCISRGKCWKKNCSACPKGPTLQEEVVLTAEVQRGMRDRDTIVFEEARARDSEPPPEPCDRYANSEKNR